MASPKRKQPKDPSTAAFIEAQTILRKHPLFSTLMHQAWVYRQDGDTKVPAGEWAVVTDQGTIHCHPKRKGTTAEWTYVIAHCLLHLGMGHLNAAAKGRQLAAWNVAADMAVTVFLDRLKVGTKPADYVIDFPTLPRDERKAYEQLVTNGLPVSRMQDLRFEKPGKYVVRKRDFEASLAQGVRNAVESALATVSGRVDDDGKQVERTSAQRAHAWFMNSYPLLGALAASFRIIEDREVCQRLDISVAAVSSYEKTIYVNPLAGLSTEEMQFVMAHEILHVALRHEARIEDRDPYLCNIAQDYVINGWLIEMGVGIAPSIGLLHDPSLKGLSFETIYDRIAKDLRRMRKLQTFRGTGNGDMLMGPPQWWQRGEGLALDDFYRNALSQGLSYHESQGAGSLPGDMYEEIKAQIQPPIPWEVELSNWFDNFFAPIETRRTYARPSRRQGSTPDIPRPRTTPVDDALDGRTFGVILDTSGSMDRITLARALGSIASYALSRDVPAVRVVFCDAAAYDAGYMEPDAILSKVKVLGRGGTRLQPGLDLLMKTEDFPDDGPILIITDAQLFEDRLVCPRPHAYLVPQGQRLPFPPKGPVFHMPPSQMEEQGW